jgi:hypothetical protein
LSRESESASWVLSNPKPGEVLDTNKVSSLSSTLSYPSFVDVAPDQSPAKTGMDKPLQVTIDTFDGFTYTLRIGDKTPENDYDLNVDVAAAVPAQRVAGKDEKPDDKKKLDKEFLENTKKLSDKLHQEKALNKWTYVVNSWLIDPIIRGRSQLMVEKKEASKLGESKTDSLTNAPFDLDPSK